MLLAQNDSKNDIKSSFEKFRTSMLNEYQNSRNKIMDDYREFRTKAMKEYTDFVRQAWAEFHKNAPVPVPKDEPLPPPVMPEDVKVLPIDNKPVAIKNILEPVEVLPQPHPVEPIEVSPVVDGRKVSFRFFGTCAAVRFDIEDKVRLHALDENTIADALEKMAVESHDNMIADCLEIRDRLALSDWAYINMLYALAKEIYASDENSATLLVAYLYMQSGYKMRLAMNDTRLYMLYASLHYVYEQPFFVVDDVRYYSLEQLPLSLQICEASFEKETPLSFLMASGQHFAFDPTLPHAVASVDYPDFNVEFVVNKNLLDFYCTVPTSMIGDNMYTRWAMYANTPMDTGVAEKLYPELKNKLCGFSEIEAANRILNLVQTGFEYRYDDEVWEGDRVFFPDECLFYSYNDCDDRSVLFSRLIRDVLGLDAALVFVPGHVLVAVEFKSEVNGGYIMVGDRKFTLCEPTCTNGSPVGWNNIDEGTELNVYLLER